MNVRKSAPWVVGIAGAVGALVWGTVVVTAQDPVGIRPPAATAPADPKAAALVAEVAKAYDGLNSLQLTGALSSDLDVAGKQEKQRVDFKASYVAPDQYRHEAQDDLLLVSAGGGKGYLFVPGPNAYEEVQPTEDPRILSVLSAQNPSLALAIEKEAGGALGAFDNLAVAEPETVDGTAYDVLTFTQGPAKARMLVDQKSRLLRRLVVDLRGQFEAEGAPDVKKAEFVIDYATTDAAARPAAETFAWTPPQDAKQMSEMLPLVAKPAPAFTAKNLAGEDVTVGGEKGTGGRVVVLDFWATWCAPCVESMPHLQELANAHKDDVTIYAVNAQEELPGVKAFVERQQLTLPVLMDPAGEVMTKYQVEPLPTTIIIGRDGLVKHVITGYNPKGIERAVKRVLASGGATTQPAGQVMGQ